MTQEKTIERSLPDLTAEIEDQDTQVLRTPVRQRGAFAARRGDPRASLSERLSRSGGSGDVNDAGEESHIRRSPLPVFAPIVEAEPLTQLSESDLDMVGDLSAVPSLPQPTPRSLPPPPPHLRRALSAVPAPIPSIVLGAEASMRHDPTERISTRPSALDLAAPVHAGGTGRSPWRLVMFGVVFLGLGAVGGFALGRGALREIKVASPVSAKVPAPIVAKRSVQDATPPVEQVEPPPQPVVTAPLPAPQAPRSDARLVPTVRAMPLVPALREPSPVRGALPKEPTREQVVATMNALMPKLTRCVGESHGVASVQMTVRANGAVSYALVDGTYAGTPEGTCLVQVLRQARFPAFAMPTLKLAYPIKL